MTDIYEMHAKAFPTVTAYAVLRGGKPVAKIAFKTSATSTRVWVYVHYLGTPMVRACADGGGYDKHTAAIENAYKAGVAAVKGQKGPDTSPQVLAMLHAARFFWDSLNGSPRDEGATWDVRLRRAGFEPFGVV